MVDPDNDYIKCRIAKGSFECGGICNSLRNAALDEVCMSYRRYIISAPISGHCMINTSLK